jgi:hypothetical protein
MQRPLNIALVGVRSGVWTATAAKELERMGENVSDAFTARRILKELPKSIQVLPENLEEFKTVFETQEFFHHQRIVGRLDKVENREVWVTLRNLGEKPDSYFAIVVGLISQPPWDKVLEGATIKLKNGVVITLDKEPE